MGQIPELADLPVIFISAYRRDETVSKALESGGQLPRQALLADRAGRPGPGGAPAALPRREAPEPFAVGALDVDTSAAG